VLRERRRIFDRIVIENLDLAEQIDDGFFEKIDVAANQAFTKLLEVSKPFRPSDLLPMSRALVKKGLLNTDQQALNDKIAQEYKLAATPKTPPGGNPQQKSEVARRSLALLYKQGLNEPLFELRRMRLAAAKSLSRTIPSLSLERASAETISAVVNRMRPEDDEQTTLDMMSRVNASLTLEQRKQLLRTAAEQ